MSRRLHYKKPCLTCEIQHRIPQTPAKQQLLHALWPGTGSACWMAASHIITGGGPLS